MMASRGDVLLYLLAVIGIILFLGSLAMFFVFPAVVSKKVQQVIIYPLSFFVSYLSLKMMIMCLKRSSSSCKQLQVLLRTNKAFLKEAFSASALFFNCLIIHSFSLYPSFLLFSLLHLMVIMTATPTHKHIRVYTKVVQSICSHILQNSCL